MRIKFYSDPNGRTSPFSSGYRPSFLFSNTFVTGEIVLISGQALRPGEEDIAEVFVVSDYIIEGKYGVGDVISFWEPPVKIGEAEILEILPSP